MSLTGEELKRSLLALSMVLVLPLHSFGQETDPSSQSSFISQLEKDLLDLKASAPIEADKTLNELAEIQHDIDASNDQYLKSLSLFVKGLAYKAKQDFSTADSLFSITANFTNNTDFTELYLDSIYEMGYAKNYSGQPERAKAHFDEVLLKSRQISYVTGELKALSGISQYYRYSLLDIQKGLLYADSMLVLSKENEYDYHEAIALNLKAIYSRDLNNFEDAIYYFNETIKVRRNNNWEHMLLSPLNEASKLYYDNNNPKMAYELAYETFEIASKLKNEPRRLIAMLNMGRSLMNSGNSERAIKILEELENEANLKSNYALQLDALSYLAYAHTKADNYSKAKEYFESALDLSDAIKSNQIFLMEAYARLELHKGNKQNALKLARQSYKSVNESFEIQIQYATKVMADVLFETDNDSAIFYGEKYLDLVFSAQTGSGLLQTENRRFLEQTVSSLEIGTWYLKLRNNEEKAFEKAEKGKSRALINSFKAREELQLFQNDPEIRSELDSLAALANSAYSTIENDYNRDSLRFVIKNYELEIEGLISKASRKSNLKYSAPPTLSLSEVQDLLDEKTALIHYSLMNNELMMFQITRDSVKTTLITESHPDFHIDSLSVCINELMEGIRAKEEIYKLNELSKPLIDILFPNEFDGLEQIENLILIPGGIMNRISFGALRTNNQYLIERFNIKYLPSASILPLIDKPHRIKNNKLYSYSNTNFTYSNEEISKLFPSYANLPYAGIERQKINDLFDSKNGFISAELAEQDFKSSISDYKFVHLATHSIVNNESPNFSKLIFTNKLLGKEQENDGHLNSIEISSLKMNADLTVLSACSTGDGLLLGGEGLQGLQRSFLIAGSSAVVVSLWEVYDSSTSEFMEIFYKELLENQNEELNWWNSFMAKMNLYNPPVFDYRPQALRDTKLAMIKHPYYNHPAYWAPFIYVGR